MNNLHRELAPISDAAWAQIEEETKRTLKRYLAGRRVVDVISPGADVFPELRRATCCLLLHLRKASLQINAKSRLL